MSEHADSSPIARFASDTYRGIRFLSVSGELDISNISHFQRQLTESCDYAEVTSMVVDLNHVTFIEAGVVRVLARAAMQHTQVDKPFVIDLTASVYPNTITRVFKLTGLYDRIHVVDELPPEAF